jgi:hypothetical protein
MDPVAPITATPGPTSSLFAFQNQPIANFNPLTVTGGYTPYTYFVSSGIIPPGLTLNPTTGVVSGTPTTVQNTAPTVFAVRDAFNNQAGTTVTVNFAVSVSSITAIASTTTSVTAFTNTNITSFYPFSSVYYGFGPYTYYVSSGTLPTGITLDPSTGLVSGIPTVSQAPSSVVFAVKDVTNTIASTTSSVSFSVKDSTYSISYVVVGGGGGASTYSPRGGGGGGGGGGGVTTGTATVSACVPYTITVGGGGPVGPPSGAGVSGNPSSIVGPTFNIIGGGGSGGGAALQTAPPGPSPAAVPNAGGAGGNSGNFPASGGSGGAAGIGYFQAATLPSSITSGAGGGGGGGAGAPGGTGINGSPGSTAVSRGGNGGAGAPVTITGTSVIYGGGGAGGASQARTIGPPSSSLFPVSVPQQLGGAGGGGNAAYNVPAITVGTNGTTNTGGGGGAGGIFPTSPTTGTGYPGFGGGSGIVIIRVPTPNYPGAYGPQATTPPLTPGQTIITYNSSGDYTA